jgi:hypothetical protein
MGPICGARKSFNQFSLRISIPTELIDLQQVTPSAQSKELLKVPKSNAWPDVTISRPVFTPRAGHASRRLGRSDAGFAALTKAPQLLPRVVVQQCDSNRIALFRGELAVSVEPDQGGDRAVRARAISAGAPDLR